MSEAYLIDLEEREARRIRSHPDQKNLSPDVVRHMALRKAFLQYLEERFEEYGNNRNNKASGKKGSKHGSRAIDDDSSGDGGLGI